MGVRSGEYGAEKEEKGRERERRGGGGGRGGEGGGGGTTTEKGCSREVGSDECNQGLQYKSTTERLWFRSHQSKNLYFLILMIIIIML